MDYIIDYREIVEQAPVEEPARQYYFMDRVRELVEMRKQEGYAAHCMVEVMGCQMSAKDGEKLLGILERCGYTVTEDDRDADVVLFTTCTVRENANMKLYGRVGRLKHQYERRDGMIIGITGCMMQEKDEVEGIRKRYPYVRLVFGTHNVYKLAELLYQTLVTGKRTFEVLDDTKMIVEELPSDRRYRFKGAVNISYGCNNFCTYCIVPYVRGRERSRRPEDIEAEVRALAAAGCREITLLGQNVNSYGKEFQGECDFADLLARLCKIEGDFIIRFMTSHPKDASHKLIDTMAANPKIARHFHLPLQSGSDRILREMNRHYDTAAYMELIDYMREKMPDISISTDIIVGFPGETDEDFGCTLDMVRRVRYDMLFSFIYSKRDGTPAAKMENQVPDEVKSARFARLIEAQAENALACNLPLEGKVVRVLVEGESKTDPEMFSGRTGGNKIVHIPAEESLRGQFADVRITKALTYALMGEVVK